MDIIGKEFWDEPRLSQTSSDWEDWELPKSIAKVILIRRVFNVMNVLPFNNNLFGIFCDAFGKLSPEIQFDPELFLYHMF